MCVTDTKVGAVVITANPSNYSLGRRQKEVIDYYFMNAIIIECALLTSRIVSFKGADGGFSVRGPATDLSLITQSRTDADQVLRPERPLAS